MRKIRVRWHKRHVHGKARHGKQQRKRQRAEKAPKQQRKRQTAEKASNGRESGKQQSCHSFPSAINGRESVKQQNSGLGAFWGVGGEN